jgi:hypothetical protein
MRRRQAKKIAKRIGWAAVCYSLASPCLGTYFHGYRHSTIRKLWRHRPPILRPVRQKQKPISYLVPNQSYAEFVGRSVLATRITRVRGSTPPFR